ncbi:uncharacterized protein Tco025E_04552, partial [Trypanosoma conorhini]
MPKPSPRSGLRHPRTGTGDRVGEGRGNFDSNAAHQSSTPSQTPDMCDEHAVGRLSGIGLPTHLRTAPPSFGPGTLAGAGGSAEWPEPLGRGAGKPLRRYSDSFTGRTSETIPFSAESPRMRHSSGASAFTTALPLPETPPLQRGGSQSEAGGLEAYLAEEMPRGRFIVVDLLSTWGAVHEVGINGLEVFTEAGERVIPPPECLRPSSSPPLRAAGAGDGNAAQERRRAVNGYYTASYTTPQRGLTVMVEYPFTADANSPATVDAVSNEGPRSRVANLVNGIHNTHDDTKLF